MLTSAPAPQLYKEDQKSRVSVNAEAAPDAEDLDEVDDNGVLIREMDTELVRACVLCPLSLSLKSRAIHRLRGKTAQELDTPGPEGPPLARKPRQTNKQWQGTKFKKERTVNVVEAQ